MATAFDADRIRLLIGMLRPERLTRVVDVGANPRNETPYQKLLSMGGCEVWGFEPQEDAFAKLVAENRPREHYFPYAVGTGGPATLHVCRGSGMTSLLRPREETFRALGRFDRRAQVLRKVSIETRRLDDLPDLPDFDLLKIDVQGSEVSVFAGARTKLARAMAVITEVAAIPLYHDQPLLDAQMRSLGELGFHLHRFLYWKSVLFGKQSADRLHPRQHNSQLIDGDAVFVRGLLDLESHDTEQLKHLAILAAAVFDSQDLCALVLATLSERRVIPADSLDRYVDTLPQARASAGMHS